MEASKPIRFNRDIRPILSENCFSCHGFDKNKRKADLRLDTKEGLFQKHDDVIPVVAGDTAKSDVIRRVMTDDADDVMPPLKSGKKLTDDQKALLRRWVEQGATWEGHWAFTAPVRPAPPVIRDADLAAAVRNPIDRFIVARLEQEGLRPSPAADKATLIRRLKLDLIGLPPTPEEVDAFLADTSPDAYEKVVDRLMTSPHFGERLALEWLDAARYADTHGYHIDSGRDMTKWREWVIDAFNQNKPFDQFTVEQLAGDLLPNATVEQKIASGFNRNNMVNFEGGAVAEEYHVAYVKDRVNTTGMVWLGLTVGCSECHDHKFDPITQKEYYQLFSYFNNVPENGLDGAKGNAVPILRVPTESQKAELARQAEGIREAEANLAGPMPDVDAAEASWERTKPTDATIEWAAVEPVQLRSSGGATLRAEKDGSIVVTGANPDTDTYTIAAKVGLPTITGVRLEALPDDSLTAHGPGRSANGNAVLTRIVIEPSAPKKGGRVKPLKVRAAAADYSQQSFPIAGAIDGSGGSGWAIYPEVGKAHEASFELEEPFQPRLPEESTNGSQIVIRLEFKSPFANHQFGRFRLSVTDARSPVGGAKVPAAVVAILQTPSEERTAAQSAQVRAYYRANISPAARTMARRVASLKAEKAAFEESLPSTMVMDEMAAPRDSFVLVRGQYDKPGDKVTCGTPAFLPPVPQGAPNNRLGLARWLVDPSHPLTSRVIVNRYWQMFFGAGIVKTSEDFGSQGELPVNPELLDWLAAQFRDGSAAGDGAPAAAPWDVHAMIRLIVTSATYRQSSHVTPDLVGRDPENRLLARGPRVRLQAEFIRDQALAVSGLLDDRIGGASVSPYQPQGLWEELMSRNDGAKWTAQVYAQSHGADLYRRTMYTFWKRTCPPPTLATFDAPDRETCTVRRAVTNTPLQALILMNDPTYVEASRKVAERLMKEGGPSSDGRIAYAFRLATARPPSEREAAVLRKIFDRQLDRFTRDPEAAAKLLAVGESARDSQLSQPELAAWTMVSSVILNLDETVTKG